MVIDDDTLPVGSPPTLEEYHRRNGAKPAPEPAAAVRHQSGQNTPKAKRKRRWASGRSCAHCEALLTEYQQRYCSNDCRNAARRGESGHRSASEAPIATNGQDGADNAAALPLAFLSTLPPYVRAVEVGGWRLVRS